MSEKQIEPNANRRADGKFGAGNNANPNGRPIGRMTWQGYADRVAHFREMSLDDVIALANDEKELRKKNSRDIEIIKAIVDSAEKNDRGERSFLLTREIGGEINKSEHTGAEGAELFGASQSVRGRLLSEPSAGGEEPPPEPSDGKRDSGA